MLSDITNSIKAKLYDFTYTPFMSSVVISWIIINHKYLLIYFGDSKLDEKLTRLNEFDFSASVFTLSVPYAMNVWYPIVFGLFYVFAYPWASKIFYEYTLNRTKELKTIKKNIEDETPITQEEARQIREDIDKLTTERDTLMERLIKAEKKYQAKFEQELKEKTSTPSIMPASLEEIKMKNIKEEDDKTKVLRFFYESNYKPSYESTLLDNIVKFTGLARPKANKIYADLMKENILYKPDGHKIEITPSGNDLLLEIFDNNE